MNDLIKQAARFIEDGKLVCLPTETVYGLATNAHDENAVKRVYEVKGRNHKNPLALMVKDIKTAKNYVKVNDMALRLSEEFCPGPISFVLPKSDQCTIYGSVNANLKTLAIRIPNNEVVQAILAEVNCPVVFTSANPSGEKEAVSADQVRNYFGNRVDMVIDGDGCSGKASTIVDLCGESPKILREGEVSYKQIKNTLGAI